MVGTVEEIEDLVKFLKDNKVQHFRKGDMEIVLSPLAFEIPLPEIKDSLVDKDNEELMYWSSGDYKDE